MVLRIALAGIAVLMALSGLQAADCNANGQHDFFEIRGGRARDCNGNGVPDECDLRADVRFDLQANFLLRGPTEFVSAADLDGDALPELITISPLEPGWSLKPISILKGATPDVLTFAAGLEAGSGPVAIATPDLDGDGLPDLAVSNGGSGDVTAVLNRGGLRFDPPTHFPAGVGPAAIVTADFNGDGRPDLAAANPDVDRITLLLNEGKGSFGPGQILAPGLGPRALAAADLDGDGAQDLAAALQYDWMVSILFGHGDGTFEAPSRIPTGEEPRWVIARDLDQDGLPDLAVGNQGSRTVTVLLNLGSRIFDDPLEFEVRGEPLAAVAGDFDGNGTSDLALSRTDRSLALFWGDGAGQFRIAETSHAYSSRSLAAADLDADGSLDLAADASDGLPVLINLGFGSFSRKDAFQTEPLEIQTADLEGDARPDLVSVNTDRTIAVLLGQAGGVLAAPIRYRTGAKWSEHAAIMDLENDGDLDFAVVNMGVPTAKAEEVVLLANPGNGTFPDKEVFPVEEGNTVLASQVDGDGIPDLVFYERPVRFGRGELLRSIWARLNEGNGTFGEPVVTEFPDEIIVVASYEMDTEGRQELVALARDPHLESRLLLLASRGDGSFAVRQAVSPPAYCQSLTVGDLDGDGDRDVALGAGFSDQVFLFFLQPDHSFRVPTTVTMPHALNIGVVIRDFDGDGRPDITSFNWDLLFYALNWGNGRFSSPAGLKIAERILDLAAADFDGDGLQDLASAQNSGSLSVFAETISVYRTRAQPSVSIDLDHDLIPDECTPRFHRGDPDGDGATDLSDAVFLIGHLFLGGEAPGCRESADADNDGQVDLTDAVLLLEYLFLGGAPPADPGPAPRPCGADPDAPGSAGALGCLSYPGC